ncbi:unnamed protein product [Prunus armeniaca]
MPKLGRVFQGKPGGRSRVWWPEPCVRERKKVVARDFDLIASHKCPPASAWRVAACRRCELSVGLSSCNWASFFDLGSCVEEVFDLPVWSINLGCPAVTGLEARRLAAGASGSLGRLICG